MDLALNNLQGLIYHKTQTTNQYPLPSLPRMVASKRVRPTGQIELFVHSLIVSSIAI